MASDVQTTGHQTSDAREAYERDLRPALTVLSGIAVGRGATKDDSCGLDVIIAALAGEETHLLHRREEEDR